MQVEARLTHSKIRHDQDFDAHLVVSLTAPTPEADDKRQALCIVPVIDVSPSMAGPKFEYAKKSILKLIDHLAPGDYCGLIQFSRQAEVIAMPTKVTPEAKDDLKRKVGNLELGSATNIAGALLKGLEVANQMDLSANVKTRVILFTDGEANVGPAVKPQDILKLVEPNLGLASVSAFGYGHDAQQDLLAGIAKDGKGNYAFVQNPDDALSAFGTELGGLLSTYATDLVLEVKPLQGHEITSVISDVDAMEKEDIGGDITVNIPDLLAEETRHLVFEVKLKEQKNAFPRATSVVDVECGFDILTALSKKERKTVEVKAKVQFVKPGEEDEKADKALDQIVGLAQVVQAQIEAEEKCSGGDFAAAAQIMGAVQNGFASRGLDGVANIAAKLGSHVASQSAYTSNSAYLASFSRGATRGMGVASYDSGAADDLKSVGVSMDNSMMRGTSQLFVEPGPGSADVDAGDNIVGPAGDAPGAWTVSDAADLPNVDADALQKLLAGAATPEAEAEPKKRAKLSSKKSSRW